ncbi:MAG: phage tail tip fiber protein, partial [Providencia rustigianii]|uniref:phage tail tip fiber protein n=1 Tax=Providencia rustigianii TaxID=158850 RepID=UPI003F3F4019
ALKGKITTDELSKETIENITKEVVDDALEQIREDVDAIISESDLIKDINKKVESAELTAQIYELTKIHGDSIVYGETVVNRVSIDENFAEMILQRFSSVTADKQIASQYLSLIAENEIAKAVLTLYQVSKTTDNSAITQEILSLTAAYLENSARVDRLTEATASQFEAQAKQITTISAEANGNKTSIYNLEQATSELEKSTAKRFTEVQSEVDIAKDGVAKNTSSITSLQQTTSDLQSSVAKDFTEVKAEIASVNDNLQYTNQSLSGLGDEVNGVKGDVKKNSAAINTQSTAIAEIDGTVKSQWTMLTETTIDGITYTSGITSINDGGKSEIIVQADKLGFIDTSDKNNKPKMMFMIVDGVMGMNGEIIATGTIAGESIKAKSTINAPHIEGGTFSGAGGKFKVLENGEVNISADPKGNVGMKITNDRIDVRGDDGKLKVRIGRLSDE